MGTTLDLSVVIPAGCDVKSIVDHLNSLDRKPAEIWVVQGSVCEAILDDVEGVLSRYETSHTANHGVKINVAQGNTWARYVHNPYVVMRRPMGLDVAVVVEFGGYDPRWILAALDRQTYPRRLMHPYFYADTKPGSDVDVSLRQYLASREFPSFCYATGRMPQQEAVRVGHNAEWAWFLKDAVPEEDCLAFMVETASDAERPDSLNTTGVNVGTPNETCYLINSSNLLLGYTARDCDTGPVRCKPARKEPLAVFGYD